MKTKTCKKCNGHGYLESVAFVGDIECDVNIECKACKGTGKQKFTKSLQFRLYLFKTN